MRDALKSYLALASGITEVSRQRALAAAKAMVAQGEATAEQVSAMAEDLVTQSRTNRDAVSALVRAEIDRALGRVGLASNDEVAALTARVRELEAQLRELSAGTAATPAPKAQKQPAKKAPAQKAPVQKAPAKKAPASRASSR